VPVFAYMYFYRTEPEPVAAGIVLTVYPTPSVAIGLYWDSACTQPATTIDYGETIHPNKETIIHKVIYIRNEGDNWVKIYWNSTLASMSDEIAEWWGLSNYWMSPPLNGTRIYPGEVLYTWYGIKIPAYATPGAFNWTLTVWGEHYY